jgi:hypothetical protein
VITILQHFNDDQGLAQHRDDIAAIYMRIPLRTGSARLSSTMSLCFIERDPISGSGSVPQERQVTQAAYLRFLAVPRLMVDHIRSTSSSCSKLPHHVCGSSLATPSRAVHLLNGNRNPKQQAMATISLPLILLIAM